MEKRVLASGGLLAAVVICGSLPALAGQVHPVPKHSAARSTPKPHVVHFHNPPRTVVMPAHVRHSHVAPSLKPHLVLPKKAVQGPTGMTISPSTPIRTGPSADAAILKHVPAGTPIPNILGAQNGFYEYVRYTGQHAWVRAADLQVLGGALNPPVAPPILTKPPAVSKTPDSGHRWGTSVAASSAILEAPSADAKVIKTIPAGTHVPDIIGEQNGFYEYVRWTHKTAFIAVSDVRLGGGPDIAAKDASGE